MQEVSGVYTSLLLHADEREMALRARKVSGLSRNGPLAGKEAFTLDQEYSSTTMRLLDLLHYGMVLCGSSVLHLNSKNSELL